MRPVLSIWNAIDSDFLTQREEYQGAIARLREHGCAVKFPVEVADISALTVNGEHAIMPIACEWSAVHFLSALWV
jgi:hypothetical protein